jgi:hypothetical protein
MYQALLIAEKSRRFIRAQVSARVATSLADELRLEIRQPHVIRPPVRAERDGMRAMIISIVDQNAANAGGAHLGKVIFSGNVLNHA